MVIHLQEWGVARFPEIIQLLIKDVPSQMRTMVLEYLPTWLGDFWGFYLGKYSSTIFVSLSGHIWAEKSQAFWGIPHLWHPHWHSGIGSELGLLWVQQEWSWWLKDVPNEDLVLFCKKIQAAFQLGGVVPPRWLMWLMAKYGIWWLIWWL